MSIVINPIEPVTIEIFKAHARITTTDAASESLMQLKLAAAREKAETYCNTEFVSKIKEVTFAANINCPIPVDTILSVSGFYSSIDQLQDNYNYFIEYDKGSIVSRDYPINYASLPTYTVQYAVHVDPTTVPAAVKEAIYKLAADLWEFRENSSAEFNTILTANYRTLLAPYRKNI